MASAGRRAQAVFLMSEARKRATPLLDRVPFRVSRLTEYCSVSELSKQTGHLPAQWPLGELRTPDGGLPRYGLKRGRCYLLNSQIVELIRRSRRLAAQQKCSSITHTLLPGWCSGEISSPGAAVTMALQDGAEGIKQISPELPRFSYTGGAAHCDLFGCDHGT
jgi:hypothetical protein